jgi:hypothetical protein
MPVLTTSRMQQSVQSSLINPSDIFASKSFTRQANVVYDKNDEVNYSFSCIKTSATPQMVKNS